MYDKTYDQKYDLNGMIKRTMKIVQIVQKNKKEGSKCKANITRDESYKIM
jgi:hypothetical protein